jgi:hypothetical protein
MAQANRPQRIDPDFERELREAMKIRLDKGLAKFNPKALSLREATTLLRRTSVWNQGLEELKTKPKKESLFK